MLKLIKRERGGVEKMLTACIIRWSGEDELAREPELWPEDLGLS